MKMKVAAVIPVKAFTNAKQRLALILDPSERALLAELMLRDTLQQACKARGLDAVFVATSTDEVARAAASLRARVLSAPGDDGETAAVHFALARLQREGVETVLVIPADIPLVRASDLELLLEQQTGVPSVLLVPSRDALGTNALVLSPPQVMRLRFGYDSFSYHLREARERGLRPEVVLNDRIALDIDEPSDLHSFLSAVSDGETRRGLLAMNISELLGPAGPKSQ